MNEHNDDKMHKLGFNGPQLVHKLAEKFKHRTYATIFSKTELVAGFWHIRCFA
jgi:hypothetical protein